jgi:hypothetical protein
MDAYYDSPVPLVKKVCDETDIFAPDFEPWERFITGAGMREAFDKYDNTYEPILIEYGKKNGFEVFNLGERGVYRKGFILRFNSQKDKLVFLLKWS